MKMYIFSCQSVWRVGLLPEQLEPSEARPGARESLKNWTYELRCLLPALRLSPATHPQPRRRFKAPCLRHEGNIPWSSECGMHKTRIIGAIYRASDTELFCNKLLVRKDIMLIDYTPS